MKKILIIDDDGQVQSLIKNYLVREGFDVFCALSSEEGLALLKIKNPDLVILDIFLPDGNGLDTCSIIRKKTKIPIILISAKGDESDKVLGLGLGADDFLTKPFSINELVARVKAHTRRSEFINSSAGGSNNKASMIISGPLVVNLSSRTAFCREEMINLTAKEFDMLAFFIQNENRVFSRDFLYESIWGYDSSGDNRTVSVHIRHLRQKIELNPNDPKILVNVWGVGYKFIPHGAL